ncbi:MAG: hypothetical protein ACE5J7_03365 [Candidatus Aenigmatarchaeota archaeon]
MKVVMYSLDSDSPEPKEGERGFFIVEKSRADKIATRIHDDGRTPIYLGETGADVRNGRYTEAEVRDMSVHGEHGEVEDFRSYLSRLITDEERKRKMRERLKEEGKVVKLDNHD